MQTTSPFTYHVPVGGSGGSVVVVVADMVVVVGVVVCPNVVPLKHQGVSRYLRVCLRSKISSESDVPPKRSLASRSFAKIGCASTCMFTVSLLQ